MTEQRLRVPLGGCAFLESPSSGGAVTERGITNWHDPSARFGVYLSFVRPARFRVRLSMRPQTRPSRLRLTACGSVLEADVPEGASEVCFGELEAARPGYMRFGLSGVRKSGNLFASPTELILEGVGPEDAAGFIPSGERDNYYWARRGPSVHATFDTEAQDGVEWFYHEAAVPVGLDPAGTYAMAVGFRGGYFGIQVNSETERRILFSVWSPQETDDPEAVQENRRVICLSKNPRTHVGEFGGEGSGGQSYVVYPWESGVRHRFLVRALPDGMGRCAFSAYFFFPDTGRFEEIATFLRPETDFRLLSPHCFLENFRDTAGWKPRQAVFSHPWACAADGRWFPPARLRFTGDATARRGWRLDFDGRLGEDGSFTLKNGGFFDGHTPHGTVFTRPEEVCPLPEDVLDFTASVSR